MRRWLPVVLALTACDASQEFLVGDQPDLDSPPDAGDARVPPTDEGLVCGERIPFEGECINPPPAEREALCAYLAAIGADCDDLDGDCYVTNCKTPLPGAVAAVVTDCDDHRPDVRPDADELCDGLDNDCDEAVDETFEVGAECAACGADGKLECAIDDPQRVACSTEPGQSQASTDLEEVCDGIDDDCDGEIDERCRFDLPPAERWRPVVCGDGIRVVEDGALVSITDGAVLDEGPVAFPACGAWLQVSAPCAAPPDGPLRCPRAHLVTADGRDVTGLAELGPPAMGEGRVWWHAIVGGTPVVQRTPVDGGSVESPYEAEALSDPTPPVAGRIAMRAWTGGEAEVVVRRVDDGGQVTVLNNGHAAGPPTLSEGWVVWPVGAAGQSLWAVPLDAPRDGFQLTTRDGPQRSPRLDGSRLVWLDEGTSPPTLRSFDLTTGVAGVVAQADIGAEDYAVAGGLVVWIEGGEKVFRATR